MNGYFSKIVQRTQPSTVGRREDLFTAPVRDISGEEIPGGDTARGADIEPGERTVVVGQPGERLIEKERVVERPGERVERVTVERPGESKERTVTERPGERTERITEKESAIERVVEKEFKENTLVERRLENLSMQVVVPPRAVSQAASQQQIASKEATRIVTPNVSPEKPLPPVSAPPALVIGKITVEVQAPPSAAVIAAARVAAAAAAKSRRPRVAAPARRQMGDGPFKLGFGLGQL